MDFLMNQILPSVCITAVLAGCVPLTPKRCHKQRAPDACTYKHSGKVSDNNIHGLQACAIEQSLDAALTDPHA
jgi:colicin import membrane protein